MIRLLRLAALFVVVVGLLVAMSMATQPQIVEPRQPGYTGAQP